MTLSYEELEVGCCYKIIPSKKHSVSMYIEFGEDAVEHSNLTETTNFVFLSEILKKKTLYSLRALINNKICILVCPKEQKYYYLAG